MTSSNAGAQVLPFYLVCDVSFSMSINGRIDSANEILPKMVGALAQDTVSSDKVRIGLVDFSDDARVRLPLCDVLAPTLALPTLSVRGARSYEAAFRVVRAEIAANNRQLKADGYMMHRPAVFFLSNGEPTDIETDWRSAFADLVGGRAYPNVIPFGVAEAEGRTLQTLIHPSTGNQQMKMYLMDKGEDAAQAITMAAEIMINSLIKTGHSISQGQSGLLLPDDDQLPSGMSAHSADDDDFG